MSVSKTTPTPVVAPDKTTLATPELTEAQVEFLDDLRVSLKEMKQGKVQPAREALREIRRELETEDDGNRPDG